MAANKSKSTTDASSSIKTNDTTKSNLTENEDKSGTEKDKSKKDEKYYPSPLSYTKERARAILTKIKMPPPEKVKEEKNVLLTKNDSFPVRPKQQQPQPFSKSCDQPKKKQGWQRPKFSAKKGFPFIRVGPEEKTMWRINDLVYSQTKNFMQYFQAGSEEYIAALDSESDSSVYSGSAGLAYLHIMLHLKMNLEGSRETAKHLIERSLRKRTGKNISFLMGDSGPLAMASVVCFLENDQRRAKGFIGQLNNMGVQIGNNPQCPVKVYDVLTGWAGYLYSMLYVNSFVKEAISRTTIRMCVAKILDDGYKNARAINSEVPLSFKSKKNYFGAAEGLAGILYMVLNSGVATSSEVMNHIQPTLTYLISQRFKGGSFRQYEGCEEELVQWCQGCPGYVDLLILCFEMFGGPYLQIAEESSNVVWERGLLKKGYSLCHGVCGNAYTFLSMYQHTKKLEQLYRAATYFQWVFNFPEKEGLKPEHPFSLFEGQAGMTYFLAEMASPENAAFPCYRLPLSKY